MYFIILYYIISYHIILYDSVYANATFPNRLDLFCLRQQEQRTALPFAATALVDGQHLQIQRINIIWRFPKIWVPRVPQTIGFSIDSIYIYNYIYMICISRMILGSPHFRKHTLSYLINWVTVKCHLLGIRYTVYGIAPLCGWMPRNPPDASMQQIEKNTRKCQDGYW